MTPTGDQARISSEVLTTSYLERIYHRVRATL